MPGVKRVAKFNWFGGTMGPAAASPTGRTSSRTSPSMPSRTSTMYSGVPGEAGRDEGVHGGHARRDHRPRAGGRSTTGRSAARSSSKASSRPTAPASRSSSSSARIYDTDKAKYPNQPMDMMLFHWKYLYEKTGQRVGRRHLQPAALESEPGGRDRQGRRRHVREQRGPDEDRDRGAVLVELPRDGGRSGADPERHRHGASRSRSCSSPPTR